MEGDPHAARNRFYGLELETEALELPKDITDRSKSAEESFAAPAKTASASRRRVEVLPRPGVCGPESAYWEGASGPAGWFERQLAELQFELCFGQSATLPLILADLPSVAATISGPVCGFLPDDFRERRFSARSWSLT
jgi:hypothetical protein